jgi:putative ATP-binding cassette transporter
MKTLLKFFRDGSRVPSSRLLLMGGIAGISNALILGVLNAGAANASSGDNLGWLFAIFIIVAMLYVYTQKYLLISATIEIENILHRFRMEQVERVRHCDLDALEKIGPARIYGGLTRQPQVLSTAAGPIVVGFQSAIVVGFTLVYLAWLDVAAFVLTCVILGVAAFIYQVRIKRAREELHEANREENKLFDSVTDLLDGFKEVRLHTRRSADLATFIDRISEHVLMLKTGVDLKLIQLFLFAQLTFYCAAAALVFLLPGMSLVEPDELFKTTIVILFLIGPITMITGSANSVAQATTACDAMLELDEQLKSAARHSLATEERLTRFDEIMLDKVVYQHDQDDDGGGFTVGPVNLAVRRGELLFISGGNGSGKSTLLKLLTALYVPREGDIRVDGRIVDAGLREAYQNLFSTVFSDFHLFRRLYGLGRVDPDEVTRLLKLMEIEGKTRLKDGQFETIALSTGQRKRLALIVAALEDRPIYIFDEWAADQDPAFRKKFYDEILTQLHARGKTIIAVTHDDRYFDRATRHLTLEEGKFVEQEARHA